MTRTQYKLYKQRTSTPVKHKHGDISMGRDSKKKIEYS